MTLNLSLALGLTRREVRDIITDWRLLLPMLVLALLFPGIIVMGTNVGLPYMRQVDPTLAGEKAALFGAIMSAFFPTSFSLIIALESFAGEKERNTLEALLATPISDGELFLGKFLAVLLPPVALSIVGLSVFTVGMRLLMSMAIPLDFLLLAMLLGVVQALTMVAAAVVISSQTCSVKAANLLASFIIIPVALAVQGEVMLMLIGQGQLLWLVLVEFVAVTLVLIRLGIRLFNREEILTRENDEFSWRAVFRRLWYFWRRLPVQTEDEEAKPPRLSPLRLYRRDLPQLLGLYRGQLLLVTGALMMGIIVGWGFAAAYPLALPFTGFSGIMHEDVTSVPALPIAAGDVFGHNLRLLVGAGLLSLFSFGVAGLVVIILTGGSIGFLAAQAAFSGVDVPTFVLAFLAPHGVLELPALMLAGALNLWLGMCLMTLPKGYSLGDGLLMAGVHWVKGAAVFVPLLLAAAFVEVHLTPLVAVAIYGAMR